MDNNICPLCREDQSREFFQDDQRDFFRCPICSLVFVPPRFHLSPSEEKYRYDLHENSPDDPNYRRFLSRLFTPLSQLLSPGDAGLDFGAGPGPTLSVMFQENGFPMRIYDYFYANDPAVFQQQYDFITATEVLEHLHHPDKELKRLWDCLKPGGYFGIMTKLVLNQAAFSTWHYKNDLTHVSFFSRATFNWIAAQWQATVEILGNDVIIFQK